MGPTSNMASTSSGRVTPVKGAPETLREVRSWHDDELPERRTNRRLELLNKKEKYKYTSNQCQWRSI